MKISLIITTYNNPVFLEMVLLSVQNQYLPTGVDLEVIIADDGSTIETTGLIKKYQENFPFQLIHVWQEDMGFRAARSRNLAALKALGEYIIYIDGDCLLPSDFIGQHILLMEPGYFVSGGRIILHKNYTLQITQNKDISITKKSALQYIGTKLVGKINKPFPQLRLNPQAKWRKNKAHAWQHHKTCNLALYKKDLLAINGFDESFSGWGYEDSDLVVRLINNNILAKNGRFAAVIFHMWHKENSRKNKDTNYDRLMQRIADSKFIHAEIGINKSHL